MNLQIFRHILRLHILLIFLLHVIGCTSFGPTKPNLPYSGKSHPTVLNELARTNPLLVQELGRLPELQDGVSEKEMSALWEILELYRSNPDQFEKAFNEMYKVGLPEFRIYCSPLQALFWLAYDGRLDPGIIDNYTLKTLFDKAWLNKESWKTLFTEEDKKKILAGVKGDGSVENSSTCGCLSKLFCPV